MKFCAILLFGIFISSSVLADDALKEELNIAISRFLPDVEIDSIEPTPIKGLYQVLIGSDVITATEAASRAVQRTHEDLGLCPGPEDVYLGLRGLRSLGVRLERHQKSALELARWLAERPEVARVIHPALPTDPGHAIWKRDFTGASGLFSIVLKPVAREKVAAMVDGLNLFGMGYSWGGFESLILPFDPSSYRTATAWNAEGPALRLHIGLEDVEDLKADLEAGFARLRG